MITASEIKRTGVGYYKGYGITYLYSEYRAEAYANPSFYNSNLANLKKQINEYLRS